jgi:hypothetical protein
MTPLASVAMLEKLALLKIALCRAPVLSSTSAWPASVGISSAVAAGGPAIGSFLLGSVQLEAADDP